MKIIHSPDIKGTNNTKADIESNPINVLHVEYQNYPNTKKDILKSNSKRMYNLFNILNSVSNS
jgi:hypothetical protein